MSTQTTGTQSRGKFSRGYNAGTAVCYSCGTRTQKGILDSQCDLCDTCYEREGLLNEHTDGHHTDGCPPRCPVAPIDPSIANSDTPVSIATMAKAKKNVEATAIAARNSTATLTLAAPDGATPAEIDEVAEALAALEAAPITDTATEPVQSVEAVALAVEAPMVGNWYFDPTTTMRSHVLIAIFSRYSKSACTYMFAPGERRMGAGDRCEDCQTMWQTALVNGNSASGGDAIASAVALLKKGKIAIPSASNSNPTVAERVATLAALSTPTPEAAPSEAAVEAPVAVAPVEQVAEAAPVVKAPRARKAKAAPPVVAEPVVQPEAPVVPEPVVTAPEPVVAPPAAVVPTEEPFSAADVLTRILDGAGVTMDEVARLRAVMADGALPSEMRGAPAEGTHRKLCVACSGYGYRDVKDGVENTRVQAATGDGRRLRKIWDVTVIGPYMVGVANSAGGWVTRDTRSDEDVNVVPRSPGSVKVARAYTTARLAAEHLSEAEIAALAVVANGRVAEDRTAY